MPRNQSFFKHDPSEINRNDRAIVLPISHKHDSNYAQIA
jgi:hypothetical protein